MRYVRRMKNFWVLSLLGFKKFVYAVESESFWQKSEWDVVGQWDLYPSDAVK
jgi:hypothetical protein